MATFTSAGLANNGRTAHFSVSYDNSLSQTDGPNRATALLAKCEQDFALMQGWFGGIDLIFSYPIPVQIGTGTSGGAWEDPADIVVDFTHPSPTISLNAGTTAQGGTPNVLRYLLVAEVTEMFMASLTKGWFQPTSLFSGADEGSKGEGLSRFLGVQFQLANGLGNVAPSITVGPNILTWKVTGQWLNSARQNFVDTNPDDNQPDPTNGCTTLFLFYLHDQLGYGVNNIIAAGASTLADVYHNLTGKTDGWTAFINLVNSHYPPRFPYNPPAESVFPVAELTTFYGPNQITTGYSESTQVFIDRPAPAEVNIVMTSDNPSVVGIPGTVTVPPGGTSTSVTFTAPAAPIPFAPKSVNVHARYAGKSLTVAAEVVAPALASVTVSPDTVVCGDGATGTVTLKRPSLLGDVVVNLICGAPGFATVPATVTIPQGRSSATFAVTTPNLAVPFKTAHAAIYATYAGNSVSAVLTVKSRVVAGILNSLTVVPPTVTGGHTSRGTVTLIEAVPSDTVVGLAAVDSGSGRLPLPGHTSSVVSVPSSVTIPAGQTTAVFTVRTSSVLPHTTRRATIIAGAVAQKYALVTVTG